MSPTLLGIALHPARISRLTEIAKEAVHDEFIDAGVVERAVRYITQAHGMPMGDDTQWLYYMLRALLEVARPNSGLDDAGKVFLHDMIEGIEQSLADE